MIPTISSLEKIVSSLPSCAPDELMLLGSYAIITRIYSDKGIGDVSLYRDTKDIDFYMFPKDEPKFLMNCIYTPTPFTAHFELQVDSDISAELFTETSYSDILGKYSSDLLKFLFEKDKDGNYLHLSKMEVSGKLSISPRCQH